MQKVDVLTVLTGIDYSLNVDPLDLDWAAGCYS
jgi:hypothetical protein